MNTTRTSHLIQPLEPYVFAGGMVALLGGDLALAAPETDADDDENRTADFAAPSRDGGTTLSRLLSDLPPLPDLLAPAEDDAPSRAAASRGKKGGGGVMTMNEPDPGACSTQVQVWLFPLQGMNEDNTGQRGKFGFTYSVVGCGAEPVGSVTINYNVTAGSAQPGQDFNDSANGTVVLYSTDSAGLGGASEVQLTVDDDQIDEPTEQAILTMTLITPSNPNASLFVDNLSASVDVLSNDFTITVETPAGTPLTSIELDKSGGPTIPNPRLVDLVVKKGGAPVGGAPVRIKFYADQWNPVGVTSGGFEPSPGAALTNEMLVTTGTNGRVTIRLGASDAPPAGQLGGGKFSARVVRPNTNPEQYYDNAADFNVIVHQ